MYPYQIEAKAGSAVPVELRVRNYRSKPMQTEAALVLPAGWKATPEVANFTIPARSDASAGFSLAIPANWDPSKPRVALAADVMADGQYLGEIAEGVVDVVA